jgi:putative membrane protein
MSVTTARERVRERPKSITAVLTVVGYALVLGALYGLAPEGYAIGESAVNLLSHSIAAINVAATLSLIAGWRFIRRDDVRNHRRAMLTAFSLILVFLVLYLTKTGLGGTKEIALSAGPVYYAYLAMLAIHVLLSIVSVPVVLYALLLGLTHTPTELRESTSHKRVGRIAASAWILSLTLGVVTYVLLNHVYGYEFVPA